MMTLKERLLAALRKEAADFLPYGARIDQWYNWHAEKGTLPERYRGWSETAVLKDTGAGLQIRVPNLFREEFQNLEVVTRKEPPDLVTEYITPKGTLTTKTVLTEEVTGSQARYDVGHMFQSEEDYPAIEYIMENTLFVPLYGPYLRALEDIGEDGVVVTGVGYSPMHQLMRVVMGYETFFYELHDHPERVEHLYEAMKERDRRKIEIAANSPVEVIEVCANWSDSIHTPVFRKYFVPWFQEIGELLHSRGKKMQVHIDGEMKRLVPLFLETGIDVAEAWTPAPMTNCTTAELREAWGDKVTIWGGVPSILFEPALYSDEEFDAYIMNLFKEVAPGYNFIVGLGDNLPVDGKVERVARIAQLIEEHARLPIEV